MSDTSTPPPARLAGLFHGNAHLLALAILVILVMGAIAVLSLPRLEDPRIVNRNPLIITPAPGFSAERVDILVTEVLEEALQEIDSIKELNSTSSPGVSIIAVELDDAVTASENQEIFSEIRDQIATVRGLLPPQALDPIIDDKREAIAFTLIVGLRWTGPGEPELGLLNRHAETLADRLRNVRGTELVRLYGAPQEEIRVEVDPVELAESGLSAADVAAALAAADPKSPAGVLRTAGADVAVEVAGELDAPGRVAAVPLIQARDGSSLTVGDLADVRRAWAEPADTIALVDGDRSVIVAVRMGFGRRVDLWAQDVEQVLDPFERGLGAGVVLDRVFEQEDYTSAQLATLTSNLVAGAAVVIAVIFIMMGWRLALIVGLALPLTVASVLFALQLSGNAVHQMSIFGMIIALGLLIDNAIVVTDEIARRKARGMAGGEAVRSAIGHLFLPLFASTLTTVLAFAPILLLPGSAGDFVGSIGQAVILALAFSFAIAMTITAGLAGRFAPQRDPDAPAGPVWRDGLRIPALAGVYRRTLIAGLRRPWIAILIAATPPALGFAAATTLGNQFFPPVDRDMFHVQIWAAPDSSIHETRRQAEAVEAEIRAFEATERVFWLVGASFPPVYYNLVENRDGSTFYAQGVVKAASDRQAREMIAPLQARLDARFPDSQIVVRQFGQGPPVVADVEYRLFGPDLDRLKAIGETVRVALQTHPDVLHTRTTLPDGQPKLWAELDEEALLAAGLRLQSVAGQLQRNLEGAEGGFVIEDLERLPVVVRYPGDWRGDLDRLRTLPLVAPGTERWTPLDAVGALELRPELGGLTRFNAERTNIIEGYTRNGALPIDVTYAVLDALEADGFALPEGYRLEVGGAVEQDAAARGNLVVYAPILVILSVATLILAFSSVRLAGVLGAVAFLSIGLGLLATFAIGFPISFNTILGTLGLIGLAFNNSIIVIAAIRAAPDARLGDPEAIAREIMGVTRHILSTTLTTIGGFLPLLIFVGGDFWPSLSIVLAGGVAGSMVLALALVPAAYRLIDPDGGRARRAAPIAEGARP